MTSIMHPGTYARVNAVQARQELATAANILRGTDIEPPKPLDGMVRIPEMSGPDSPDNPWFVAPGRGGNGQAAMTHATKAVDKITAALTVGSQLGAGSVRALESALQEAQAGVRYLEAPSDLPLAPGQATLQFDAATMWLNLAVNLIDLDMRGGGTIPMPRPGTPPTDPTTPPVTILPVPGPGDPGSPITIKPLEA